MSGRDDVPSFVRPFVITGGRTRATDTSLRMETLVQTSDGGHGRLVFEHARVVELCREPHSIAEIAAKLPVPLGVAMVLVDDLAVRGCLSVHHRDVVEIELSDLTRMINRVRAL